METDLIIDLLRDSIDPNHTQNQRKQAEKELEQGYQTSGFAVSLLEVVIVNDTDSVCNAAVSHLKNMILWHMRQRHIQIHEEDQYKICDRIVDAFSNGSDSIRVQLKFCYNCILQDVSLGKCNQIVDKIGVHLQSPEGNRCMGALISLHLMIQLFEYQNNAEIASFREKIVKSLLPSVQQILFKLLPELSAQSLLLQKQCLKIFHSLMEYLVPVMSKSIFSEWMGMILAIAHRPDTDQTYLVDKDERSKLPWWKCRKWAMQILLGVFQSYGSSGNPCNSSQEQEYSDWFKTTFSSSILKVIICTLHQYCRKSYLSPKVLHQALTCFRVVGGEALKTFNKYHNIFQDIIFPVLCNTDGVMDLWNRDEYRYIRSKFEIEDYESPVELLDEAASTYESAESVTSTEEDLIKSALQLLRYICQERRDILMNGLQFLTQVLAAPLAKARQIEGGLYMLGSLAGMIVTEPMYNQPMMEQLHQYLRLLSPKLANHGYLRATFCYTLGCFHSLVMDDAILKEIVVYLLENVMKEEEHVIVKVVAALSLGRFVASKIRETRRLTLHVYLHPHRYLLKQKVKKLWESEVIKGENRRILLDLVVSLKTLPSQKKFQSF